MGLCFKMQRGRFEASLLALIPFGFCFYFSGTRTTGLIAYYTFASSAPLKDIAGSLGDLQASGDPS